MELPTEEHRRWRELAVELRRDRLLAACAARFDVIVRWRRNVEAARAGTAIPAMIWMPAAAGGCLGLALVTAGALVGNGGLSTAGMAVLVSTLVLAGIALLAIGTASSRHSGGSSDR
ncbi:MAG: hypothetical protein ACRDNW_03965 [Trebonia sp.]